MNLLEIFPESPDALAYFSESSRESRGEVLTKREIVEFILDLTGWSHGPGLRTARLLEPSAGTGDFIIPAIERLLLACPDRTVGALAGQIRAVEVNRATFELCRSRVSQTLADHGYSPAQVKKLVGSWLIHGDFLTADFPLDFTHVVGNPPYLRQEALPSALLKLYRSRYETMYDRADLYIPFFERGLDLLAPDGVLGFICADRWMKNKYGGPLRQFVSDRFHLSYHIDFTGCPAFHDDVIAYPAVTVIRNGEGKITRTAHRPKVSSENLTRLAKVLISGDKAPDVTDALDVVVASSPWLLDQPARLNVIRKIEEIFPTLEEAKCQVGIGVATGVDKIYIRKDDELPVEIERKIPIVLTRDLKNGEIDWGGKMLLNPFDGDTPKLVDPKNFPLFAAYLSENREAISRRHVAKKNPRNWFKTIDRIYPSLAKTPKLLIPDIKGEPTVVFDEGHYYPHHNFYYVISKTWELRALQAVLLSPVAQAFVAAYSLRMRGDCLRYQAQYLRRIRLPHWEALSKETKESLTAAGISQDPLEIKLAVQPIFRLDESDWGKLSGI